MIEDIRVVNLFRKRIRNGKSFRVAVGYTIEIKQGGKWREIEQWERNKYGKNPRTMRPKKP